MQINHTFTRGKGVVRGMHFQLQPYQEIKLVSCLRGKVFDVAVDLRKNSPTFLQWHGEVLSARKQQSFLIPEGLAHGFQALTYNCELLYFHTAPFQSSADAGVNATDPRLGILWPLDITQISSRDKARPYLSRDFRGFEL